MLQFQRDRDAAGGGVVLRSVADAALNDAAATPGLRRADAKAHVLRSIDRLLSDEARTAALESAADAATASEIAADALPSSGGTATDQAWSKCILQVRLVQDNKSKPI